MLNRARLIASLFFALAGMTRSASPQSLSWSATYDGGPTLGQSHAFGPHGVAVDALGNTYAAGVISAGTAPEPLPGGASTNGLIVKYGPAGQVIWSHQIEGSILSVALDSQQRLLVLTANATLTYSPSGSLVWRASQPLDGRYLSVTAMAAGPAGSVYLAGSVADNSTGHLDLALARLDGSGRLLWLRTWNGPQNLDDEAQSLGVDTAERIYVAGRSRRQEGPDLDAYATVAFDAAGAVLWSRVLVAPDYSGPAAFAADPAGGAFLSVPLGSAPDWRSLKYDAAGTLSWSSDFSDNDAAHASVPDAAAVAPDGASYVSGHASFFPGSTALVRYTSSGAEQWAKVASSAVIAATPAAALGVDAASHAIVVVNLDSGLFRTSAYDVSGAVVWSNDFLRTAGSPPGPVSVFAAGVAIGPSGEARILSTALDNPSGVLLTVAYDGAGSPQWNVEAPAVAPDEGGIAVRYDGSGNALVLATGFSNGRPVFRTLKYDVAGALVWARAFPGHPAALLVDGAGEVVAAGSTDGPTGPQLAVVKYDAAGAESWTRLYLPPGFSGLYPGSGVGLAGDATGNVYVTGRVVSGDVRAVVVKYAPDGAFQWARTGAYPIADPIGGVPRLVVSPNGNVIVGGGAYPAGTFQYHVWALDPAGNTVWNVIGDSTKPAGSNVGAMTVDAFDNVIVGDFYSGRVDKLSPAGTRLWSIETGDRVIALSADPMGGIAVASGLPYGFRIGRYSSAGGEVWSRSYSGEPITVWSWALRATADGRTYGVGAYWDAALGFQKAAFAAVYDPAGQVKWARASAGSGTGSATFNDLDLDAAGRLVAAGYTANGSMNYDVLVQSITDDPTSAQAFHTVAPCRVFDSRDAALGGPAAVSANAPYEAQVANRCGVPPSARSVALNVTVTGATDAGHVTLYPAGRVPPPTSTINHAAGATRAALSVVGLGDGGRVVVRAIQGSGSVHVILDVSGYFE